MAIIDSIKMASQSRMEEYNKAKQVNQGLIESCTALREVFLVEIFAAKCTHFLGKLFAGSEKGNQSFGKEDKKRRLERPEPYR